MRLLAAVFVFYCKYCVETTAGGTQEGCVQKAGALPASGPEKAEFRHFVATMRNTRTAPCEHPQHPAKRGTGRKDLRRLDGKRNPCTPRGLAGISPAVAALEATTEAVRVTDEAQESQLSKSLPVGAAAAVAACHCPVVACSFEPPTGGPYCPWGQNAWARGRTLCTHSAGSVGPLA